MVQVQSERGLPVTGRVDNATWPALLSVPPAAVSWRRGGRPALTAGAKGSVPQHLDAPDVRNELAGKPRG